MNQIATIPQFSVATWTSRQLDTIKRTVASDTNDDEFNLFIEYAKSKKLDPFSKQIIAVVYSKNDPDKRKMTIIVTQDGQRVLASRCRDYRPAEVEPEFVYSADLKSPINPFGIEKVTVTLFKQDSAGAWHPIKGWAYWDEYAPTKDEWVYDQDAGKRKPSGKKTLEGNWAKMPRVMLAKCANMVALRSGWPETFAGAYAEEEMDQARVQDMTASEMVEAEREQRRLVTIAALENEFAAVDAAGTLVYVPAGRYGDQILEMARLCETVAEIDAMESRNRDGLKRFWAKHKSDALQVRTQLGEIRKQIAKVPA
jgi:phage recombination protein Bet